MQSSGVGNIINVLGMVRECRFPLLMIVTMRGEQGEFNPWQVPMGQATRTVLEAMGAVVPAPRGSRRHRAAVDAALRLAYGSDASVAVLIPQTRHRHQELSGAARANECDATPEVVKTLLEES